MIDAFLREFGHLVETPGGIKLVRDLAYNLALQGRFSHRAAGDDDIATIVRKLEQAQPKNGGPVLSTSRPWDIPTHWRWVSLDALGPFVGGGTPSKGNSQYWGGAIPWVSPKDMKRVLIDSSQDTVTELAVDQTSVKAVPSGSLLMVVRGMILAHSFPVALTTRMVTINQDMKALCFHLPEIRHYVLQACIAGRDRMLENVAHSTHGTCRIGTDEIKNFPIPLPPVEEQRRICGKLRELSEACDELEAKQTQKRKSRTRLNEACLDRLLTAQTPDEFAEHWRRIHDNFDLLIDTPGETAELSRAIRTLGVFGHLTSDWRQKQPANSAEARKQLQERDCLEEPDAALVAALPPIPKTWQWTTLGALTDIVTSGSRGWKKYYADTGSLFIRSQDIKKDQLDLEAPAFVALPGSVEGKRTRVEHWDILTTITGANVGKCAVLDTHVEDGYVSQHVALARLKDPVFATFVHAWMTASAGGRRILLGRAYGDKPGLNLENLRTLPVPMPPLEEQGVIMRSIARLMAIGSALQANLNLKENTAQQLLAALVHTLASDTEDTRSLPERCAPTDAIATRDDLQAFL